MRELLTGICLVGATVFAVAWVVLVNRWRLARAADRIARTPRSAPRSWILYFVMAMFAMLACAVFLFEHRCNRVYRAEMEFVCWHDAEVTNRLCEIDSGTRGYTGPSAAFVFEERLMMYKPMCVSQVTANAQTELRRLGTAIEGLKADIKRVNSLGNDTELRVFRIR